MDIPTNCPNCSAPINNLHNKCAYCDTPYPWKKEAEVDSIVFEFEMDPDKIAKAVHSFFMTPNEMRRLHGLRDI